MSRSCALRCCQSGMGSELLLIQTGLLAERTVTARRGTLADDAGTSVSPTGPPFSAS